MNATRVFEVPVGPYPGDPGPASTVGDNLASAIERFRTDLAGRQVWHVNSTADGGGVAELLYGYVRHHTELGIPTRWAVADAEPEFFAVTKKLYHLMYGVSGPGSELSPADGQLYQEVTAEHAKALTSLISPRDIVVLHDSQTLGMAPALADAGVPVVWHCHLGSVVRNEASEAAWSFFAPYLPAPAASVFSRQEYVPAELTPARAHVIMPAIDSRSAKNRPLPPRTVRGVLAATGLGPGPDADDEDAALLGRTAAELAALATVRQTGPVPDGVTLVTQVSRWDRLKDMLGVLRGFALAFSDGEPHLVLVGPDPTVIADDPGGVETFNEVTEEWHRLPTRIRDRVHLVTLAGSDLEGTAYIINAIQARSDIVVQKSLKEGFGLTVTEGKWKGKPVISAATGGLTLQVDEGVTGLSVPPEDPEAFAQALLRLEANPGLRHRIGEAGRADCATHFLIDRQLREYLEVFLSVAV